MLRNKTFYILNYPIYLREFALPKCFKEEKARRNIIDFLIDDKKIVDFKAKTIITKMIISRCSDI